MLASAMLDMLHHLDKLAAGTACRPGMEVALQGSIVTFQAQS